MQLLRFSRWRDRIRCLELLLDERNRDRDRLGDVLMFADLCLRVRSLFRSEKVESELDEELRFHVEREAEKYVRTGMPQPMLDSRPS